ncbi:hypothetical protein K438DRAFT_1553145, partial [Mycena galopus ATCC 62051]
ELYDDPESFIPDRYLLTENGTKPGVDGSDLRSNLAFGVGRRICPDIHVAQNSVARRHLTIIVLALNRTQNLNAMNLVWAFNF